MKVPMAWSGSRIWSGRGSTGATGNAGANIIKGGDGGDVVAGSAGNEPLDGEAGVDTASFAAAVVAVSASLSRGDGSGGGCRPAGRVRKPGRVELKLEVLDGRRRRQHDSRRQRQRCPRRGVPATTGLSGSAGNDSIVGRGGNDVVDGGVGAGRGVLRSVRRRGERQPDDGARRW